MSESKHTPGPWRVQRETTYPLFTVWGHAPNAAETPLLVAKNISEANARLIAAAPDLLAAAKACLAHDDAGDWRSVLHGKEQLRAAIARAKAE